MECKADQWNKISIPLGMFIVAPSLKDYQEYEKYLLDIQLTEVDGTGIATVSIKSCLPVNEFAWTEQELEVLFKIL